MSHAEPVPLRSRERSSALSYLVPECVVYHDGTSAVVELGSNCGKLLIITLQIHSVTEQDGLMVSIWGSSDKVDWGTTPLLTFPTRSYCGLYSALLNLAAKPEIRYVRGHWSIRRCSKGDAAAVFGFSVLAEESGSRITGRGSSYGRLQVVRGA